MYYVYILQSEKDGNLYTGFTNNLERRLKQHNLGRVQSTKHRIPFQLIYKESHKTQEEAIKREKFLKSGCGRDFIRETVK
ncbi:GIY-YIG nuclease family protein [Candidatus Margulisiibacteriota bacterium]